MILLNLEAPTDILVLSFAGHTVIISAATAATAIQERIRWVDRTYKIDIIGHRFIIIQQTILCKLLLYSNSSRCINKRKYFLSKIIGNT